MFDFSIYRPYKYYLRRLKVSIECAQCKVALFLQKVATTKILRSVFVFYLFQIILCFLIITMERKCFALITLAVLAIHGVKAATIKSGTGNFYCNGPWFSI